MRGNTFDAIGREFVEQRKQEGAAAVTLEKLTWLLHKKLGPVIGNMPVTDIKPVHLLEALRLIEADKLHETANRAKRVAGQILRYAVATGRAERDITQDLRGALIIKKAVHRAAITDPEELKGLLLAIDGYKGTPEVAAALQITPLLFQRPGEIRHMEWAEIDWEQDCWEIPAEKMKMRLPHIVPLARQVLVILKGLQPLTGHGQYVFPNARRGGQALSENGVRTALRTLGYTNEQVTPTGFSRNTVRRYLRNEISEPLYPKRQTLSKLDAFADKLSQWLSDAVRTSRKPLEVIAEGNIIIRHQRLFNRKHEHMTTVYDW